MAIRVLLLADTHLGFDLPTRPRVSRRRRGRDFQASYETALASALEGEVDLVVHGGDVFHRPRVPPSLAFQAFEPLRRVAEAGVPVFLVPGNHERSRLPHLRFASHRLIHVFDRPRTFRVAVRGTTVAVAGFPYQPKIRERFRSVVNETGWDRGRSDAVRLLCVHHCFEGASVEGFTFRHAGDVIRLSDVPAGVAAVFSGHIHRRQVLTKDLRGRVLSAPVLSPGSVERTSFAERLDAKGYLRVELPESDSGEDGIRWYEKPLPARPMVVRKVDADGLDAAELEGKIKELIETAPTEAVLRVRLHGHPTDGARRVLGAEYLRGLTPATMNLDVVMVDEPRRQRRTRGAPQAVLPLA
jgi:DNA repair exonuclease SbcCD nuclease subunit